MYNGLQRIYSMMKFQIQLKTTGGKIICRKY